LGSNLETCPRRCDGIDGTGQQPQQQHQRRQGDNVLSGLLGNDTLFGDDATICWQGGDGRRPAARRRGADTLEGVPAATASPSTRQPRRARP